MGTQNKKIYSVVFSNLPAKVEICFKAVTETFDCHFFQEQQLK